ncbi:uncharacterized protein [Typha angustifolia]|uniref:uncharacterized protein n=1 Tax=Typha angustifolia TaxID=59011 RepID=UPI003C30C019
MPWCSWSLGSRIRSFLLNYDRLQAFAIVLIYIQIGCALVGSIGALYNGVLLINLVVALFALVAIESSSQSLGRTYAVLLFFAILLDVAWFILFSHTIWNITADEKYGLFFVFSVRVALWMQIVGFSVRFLSSFLWIQIYRLGPSSDSMPYQEADCYARNSFLSPSAHGIVSQNSNIDVVLGDSTYDSTYYSSLFKDSDNGSILEGDKQIIVHDGGSISAIESPQLKSCISKSFQASDVSTALRTPLIC